MNPVLRLGVAGLGRAFTLTLPTFAAHSRIKLVAAADPRQEAIEHFKNEFRARGYSTIEALCADPNVQAVYVASPHQYHVAHLKIAAAHGKHVLVEKPMALSTEECLEMISIAKSANIHLLVGHSHSYDLPYLKARELISSGSFGSVRMITAMNFTDYLYRPRRPEELETRHGGGVVFSQSAHQIDVARLLATSSARSVRALTGNWDPKRPTEGAYNAQILFSDNSFASLTYSGYGHFDSDEFNGWRGELGQPRDPNTYGEARRALMEVKSTSDEIAMKNRRAYGTTGVKELQSSSGISHNHFGLFIVSCEHADLRPMPNGVLVYSDNERWLEEIPRPRVPRSEVVDELYDAVIFGRPPLHSGEWGLATLEICLAILEASESNQEVSLCYSREGFT